MIWRVWFGEVHNGSRIVRTSSFEDSFEGAHNSMEMLPLPFSLVEAGLQVFKSREEYYKTLRKVAIDVARKKIEREIKREDRYAIMLLKTLDQVDESMNLLKEKLKDIEEVKESEITEELNKEIKEFMKLRKQLEREIEGVVAKIAPNLSEILGGVIAARLLEKVGSLEKLASLPASTIQILGAERSLYKAKTRMKKGRVAKTPKHGIIFQHPYIRTLPKSKRGSMSRFIAAKLAIAARIDFFKGELREELAESVRRKYEELLRK